MNWISQKSGIINHFNSNTHSGTQPVRVVHSMLTHMFQNTHASFFKDLAEQIKLGKLNRELKIEFGEEPIKLTGGGFRTPRVIFATKQIELHETFLSYLWCSVYSAFVTYIETIDYPRVNQVNGRITHPINQDNIETAKELFDHAKYLIVDYIPWDKNKLPNPEIYLAEKRTYIEQTNCYYTEAVKFILCHEYTHLKHHVEEISSQTTNSQYLEFEIEADNNAIDLMKKGISYSPDRVSTATRLVIENGIIFGLLSMFYFRASTEGTKHPNAEDRLTNALERLGLCDNSPSWGIACVGLQMWDEQFGLNFTWNSSPISYKEQYYEIIQQIKKRQ